MSFGSALRYAFNAAGEGARNAVRATLAGAKSAATAVADSLIMVGNIAMTGGGELINFVTSIEKIGCAKIYKVVTAPYRMAEQLFSDSQPAGNSVSQPCPLCDKARVFTSEYRRKLIGSEFSGAGSEDLRAAMIELSKDSPNDVKKHLETMAENRQRPLPEIENEYQRFRELRQIQLDDIAHSDGKLEPIDQLKIKQRDFMGSNWQLRYGKVVGDRLDLDPSFAAMLNPTGGLVGPGNMGWRPDGVLMPESVAYHGTYHDAMGYLLNYQKQGPGYNYMESPFGFAKDNPLAGQSTGIAQWALDLAK